MVKSLSEIKEDAKLIVEGSDVTKVYELLKDNQKYRSRIQELKDERDSAVTNLKGEYEDKIRDLEERLPGEGVATLPKDEADFVQWLKDSYGNFDVVKGKLADYDSVKSAYEADKNRLNILKVSKKHGFNEEALEKLFTKAGLKVVVEDDKEFVLDGDKKSPFDEYVETEFEVFLPSLKSGNRHPGQGIGKDGDGGENLVEGFIKRKNNFHNKGDN